MMSAPGRGSALLRSSRRVCSQCTRPAAPRIPITTTPATTQLLPRTIASVRYYAAEASAPAASAKQPSPSPPPPTTSTTTSNPPPPPVVETTTIATANASGHYRLRSALILTRPPLLTREPHPFEAAFYLYQKRLNERLTAPFRRGFYFKPDSAADLDFRIKLRERNGVPAKDIGRYNPRGRMAWNDEVLVGSTTSDPRAGVVDQLLADAEVRVSEDGEPLAPEERVPVERPMPRVTRADEEGDVRRLDRKLERTLYLVVKKGGQKGEVKEGEKAEEGVWEFPSAVVPTEEALHETAARALAESAGVNMNTWIVGRVPVAHHVVKPVLGDDGASVVQRGEKTFFLKGRIMAGQADLAGNKHGLTDFQWLTEEELREVLPEKYYHSVRGMFELR